VGNPVTSTPVATETIELAPSYTLPIGIILLALPIGLLNRWAGLPIGLLGLFLLLQSVLLRLRFTPTALELYRGDTQLRSFLYSDWQNWEIFWGPVPILFYFKEVNSIHFLPIIFAPATLRTCLEQRFPK
jgi:Protein of unknown function (DUF3119)